MRIHPNLHVLFQAALLLCWSFLAGMSAAQAPATQPNADPARQQLQQTIEQANRVPEHEYSIASWNAMRFTLNDARAVARNQGASPAELQRAHAELHQKLAALENRALPPDTSPKIGLAAWVFATDPAGPVNNAALMWDTADPADRFELFRATSESGPFEMIYQSAGKSFHDYALKEGSHIYRIDAYRGGDKLSSNLARVSTMAMPAELRTYSNEVANEQGLPENLIKIGDTYYRFRTERDGTAVRLIQHTSMDAQNWRQGPVVMDQSSHPDIADCKFEAVNIFHDDVNDQIVFWCHWELSGPRYGHGRALVATAKPGERFKVHHVYNPLGIQVRDMSVFIDDDKQGYLVAASNVPGQGANATIYIFRLNKTYDDVVEIVAKVVENGYREAPHIVKHDGIYYLFFSQAAGWYPSRGGYISAPSLEGRWSEARSIGNPSTFSSQSGGINHYGDGDKTIHVMMGNRWIRGDGTNRQVALPLHLANGFAFYDYAPHLLHDTSRNVLIPLQIGRLLSQDQPARASIPGKTGNEPSKAFDGDYDSFFQSDTKQWPFTLTSDLGRECDIRNVQISWYIHKGSEAYYTYKIEGSNDARQWTTLVDQTNTDDTVVSKTYGFTSDILPEGSRARYVRINVQRAHLHNNPSNWYPPTVYEVRIYGRPGASTAE